MSFSAGQRIEAKCTRCKDLTSHIVVVVLDNLPAKVECCACKSIHKYYPPEKKKEKKEPSVLRVSPTSDRDKVVEKAARKAAAVAAQPMFSGSTPKTSTKKAPAKSIDYEEMWKASLARAYGSPIPYSMTVKVKVNDVVEHPTFGTGIVQECLSHDKMSILFKEGIKMLKCQC